MQAENIADQKYWDKSYEGRVLSIADNPITKELDRLFQMLDKKGIKPGRGSSCFEVGCYPGGFLAYFGKKHGYEVNGVDLTSELDDSFLNFFMRENIKTGILIQDDFQHCIDQLYRENITFDVVYSIGFIEHFRDYNDVILFCGRILKPGGLMIVETPNFRGRVQHVMHYIADKQNLNRYVIAAMNPEEWARVLGSQGYEIFHKGYFGGFRYWSDIQRRTIFQKVANKCFVCVSHMLENKNIKNSMSYSPYCILVARKREEKEQKENENKKSCL